MLSISAIILSAISFVTTTLEDNAHLIAPAHPQSVCQARARKIISRVHPQGANVLRFTAGPKFLDKLITCRSQRMFWIRLPNYLHEMVHYSGFKLLGFGPKRIRVRLGQQSAQIGTRRTDKNMHDEAFFFAPRSTAIVRGLKVPGRRIVASLVPASAWRNSIFGFYLRSGARSGGYLSLLDELHAYTLELELVTRLYPRTVPRASRTFNKDNVVGLQLMVLLYLKAVRTKHPAAYRNMRNHAQVVDLTKRILDQSDRALRAATKKRYPRIRLFWPGVARLVERNRDELAALAP